jgi:hypothetical protein
VTGIKITLPALTDKDKGDLIFGCQQGVDFVAASFIRKAEDIVNIRQVCPVPLASFPSSLLDRGTCCDDVSTHLASLHLGTHTHTDVKHMTCIVHSLV